MAFITNQENKNLKNRISQLIQVSKELKFLVGFFYFSGIEELYKSLRNRFKYNDPEHRNLTLKILVGLETDKIQERIVEIAEESQLSSEEYRERYFRSIAKALNSKEFDNQRFYEQVHFFIELIKNGKLQIKKTRTPNHAKLYIFKLDKTQIGRKAIFITGSSNLTKAGLNEQKEFNVEISDFGVEEAERYFDEEWEVAIPITAAPDLKARLLRTLEQETLIKEISPFTAYAWVLKSYIDYFQNTISTVSPEILLKSSGYKPFKYQTDAINQALSIINQHNGVIIADVVGLGKSVIASAVARILGRRGVVICPPAIMGDRKIKDSGWWGYLEDFGLTKIGWEVWSIGELEKLHKYLSCRENSDIEIVIVDEAHRFRNEDTKSYELLKNITRGKKVILLTATPFNNRPSDILSLLKLFIVPKKSSISLEDDLLAKFATFKSVFEKLNYIIKHHSSFDETKRKKAENYYKALVDSENPTISVTKVNRKAKFLAKEIRAIIEPVTIRRNRLDLIKNPRYKDEIHELSEVADPEECFFELREEQMDFYDSVISWFLTPEEGGRFRGAMYRPFDYEKILSDEDKLSASESFEKLSQRNLYDMMRRLLVKRFESSFYAFKRSIENFKHTLETVIKFIEKTNKYVLDRKLIEDIYQLDPEEIETRLKDYEKLMEEYEKEGKSRSSRKSKNYKIYDLKKFAKYKEFKEDLHSDLKMFNEILKDLESLNLINNDPKLAKLIEKLQWWRANDPKRKIVIFSEYADTVEYLGKKLKDLFGGKILAVRGSMSEKRLDEIRKNFDASVSKRLQENEYDILISTDKLSEGINLNRAGIVVNYDIPWNPVRVIQRVGRINRISKKVFDKLHILNFFPTQQGSDIVKSREIAAQKMFMIHKVLGEDSKIFDIDEEPEPSELYRRLSQNPEETEEESFFTKLVKEYEKIKEKYPEIVNQLNKLPPRLKVGRRVRSNPFLLVFFKKNRALYAIRKFVDSTEIHPIRPEEALSLVRCSPEEPGIQWNSDTFWENYTKIMEYRGKRLSRTEKSLENQADNVLGTILQRFRSSEIIKPHWKFLLTLREDLREYYTLPDYTLRTIIELEEYLKNEKTLEKKIAELKQHLGEDYLKKEKQRLGTTEKEVILAVYYREGENVDRIFAK